MGLLLEREEMCFLPTLVLGCLDGCTRFGEPLVFLQLLPGHVRGWRCDQWASALREGEREQLLTLVWCRESRSRVAGAGSFLSPRIVLKGPTSYERCWQEFSLQTVCCDALLMGPAPLVGCKRQKLM